MFRRLAGCILTPGPIFETRTDAVACGAIGGVIEVRA
jgi:hypothetical protein